MRPNALVEFRSSPIHGFGGFARKEISAGTLVLEYVGEIITKEESLRRCMEGNQFIFALDDECDLDGSVDWNPARLLNHSCAPNCDAVLRDGRVWIVSAHRIEAGDELTFDYGYDLDDYEEHPCHCGAENCVGYIVAGGAFADYIRQRQRVARR